MRLSVKQKTILLKDIQFLVLDEADEMMDMGFADEITVIMDDLAVQNA